MGDTEIRQGTRGPHHHLRHYGHQELHRRRGSRGEDPSGHRQPDQGLHPRPWVPRQHQGRQGQVPQGEPQELLPLCPRAEEHHAGRRRAAQAHAHLRRGARGHQPPDRHPRLRRHHRLPGHHQCGTRLRHQRQGERRRRPRHPVRRPRGRERRPHQDGLPRTQEPHHHQELHPHGQTG